MSVYGVFMVESVEGVLRSKKLQVNIREYDLAGGTQ